MWKAFFGELGTTLHSTTSNPAPSITDVNQVGHRHLVDAIREEGDVPVDEQGLDASRMMTPRGRRKVFPRSACRPLVAGHPAQLCFRRFRTAVEHVCVRSLIVGWLGGSQAPGVGGVALCRRSRLGLSRRACRRRFGWCHSRAKPRRRAGPAYVRVSAVRWPAAYCWCRPGCRPVDVAHCRRVPPETGSGSRRGRD